MKEAVIVSAVRTPVGRAPKGALSTTRPDDLAAIAMCGALDRVPALDKSEIDDVVFGCAQPEGEQGWNIARFAALRAQLPVEIPGVTVNRLCASGLEAIVQADLRIRAGGDSLLNQSSAAKDFVIRMRRNNHEALAFDRRREHRLRHSGNGAGQARNEQRQFTGGRC